LLETMIAAGRFRADARRIVPPKIVEIRGD
jgi:hypothetical protein